MIIGLWWLVAHNARLRVGAGPRRPRLRRPPHRHRRALRGRAAAPVSCVRQRARRRRRRPAAGAPGRRQRRVCACGRSSLRGPRSSSGRAAGGRAADDARHAGAGPPRACTRHGDARRRLGRAVRAAVVDAAGCGSRLPSALHVSPRLRAGRSRRASGPTEEEAGVVVDRPRADAGPAPRRPPVRAPATAGGSSTGARPRTPARSWCASWSGRRPSR